MKAFQLKAKKRERRARHVRNSLVSRHSKPRLSVHRSLKHISAQVIDDLTGRTLAAVTSTAKSLEGELSGKNKTQRAAVIGAEIARRATQAGVETVVFDRGFCRFHGRVKALADAARAGGLKF